MESTFSKRLTQACDDNPLIPDYGHGRQVTIANKLDVSQEAVRKWFTGDSVPRSKKMKVLAEFLNVSEPWLALGISPSLDRTARKEMVRVTKGAVHMLAGMISLEGGNFAFPSPEDSRSSFVDLYAIKDGQKIDFHVSVGREIKSDDGSIEYEFIIPRQYSQINLLGLIYLKQGEIEWINMPTELIDAHKEVSEGSFRVLAKRDNGKYSTENDKWVRFRTIGDIL